MTQHNNKLLKTFLTCSALTLLIFSSAPSVASARTKSDYATLSREVLPSTYKPKGHTYNLSKINPDTIRALPTSAPETQNNAEDSGTLLQTHPLSDMEQLSQIFEIFALTETKNETAGNEILSSQSWKDIALFRGEDKASTSLHRILSHTLTPFGQARLAHLLANPTTNIATLRSRQGVIAASLEDRNLTGRLSDHLSGIEPFLDELFSFWDDFNTPSVLADETFYYKNIVPSFLSFLYDDSALVERLNSSSAALEIRSRLTHVGTGLSIISPILLWIGVRAAFQKGVSLYENKVTPVEPEQTAADIINPKIEVAQEFFRSAGGGGSFTPEIQENVDGFKTLLKAGYARDLQQHVANGAMSAQQREMHILQFDESLDSSFDKFTESLGAYPEIFASTLEYFKNKSFFEALRQSAKDAFSGKDIKHFYILYRTYLNFMYRTIRGLYENGATKTAIFTTVSTLVTNGIGLGIPLFIYKKIVSMALGQEWSSNDLSNYLQMKLSNIARVFDHLRAMHDEIAAQPELAQNLEGYEHLEALFGTSSSRNSSKSSKLTQLIELLRANTFTGESSFFSRRGNIMVAYKLMREVKNELILALEAVGQLDALLGVADFAKNATSQEAQLCFPEYIEDAHAPELALRKFWNPFIDAKQVVTNDVLLGHDESSNLIITGPNAGGKSTILKSVIICALLAQTIGMTPAESAHLTPFASINTYLNITDDIAAGNSHYKAEVLRAQDLIDTVTSLEQSSFSLTICDEIFNGTNPAEGAAGAYAVAEYLGEATHSIMLLATHYPLLTGLEEKHPGRFANFKVSVIEHEDGRLEYPYKLLRGVTDQNIAIAMLQNEGFDSSIVEKAKEILAQGKK